MFSFASFYCFIAFTVLKCGACVRMGACVQVAKYVSLDTISQQLLYCYLQ